MVVNPFLLKTDEATVRQNQLLTALTFFGKEDGGYCEKHEFLAWGESSRVEDVSQVKKFLELAKSGCRIIQTSTLRVDKGGVPYKYVTFLLPSKHTDGAKLVQTNPWASILEDLLEGSITINVTLEELIEEARNS